MNVVPCVQWNLLYIYFGGCCWTFPVYLPNSNESFGKDKVLFVLLAQFRIFWKLPNASWDNVANFISSNFISRRRQRLNKLPWRSSGNRDSSTSKCCTCMKYTYSRDFKNWLVKWNQENLIFVCYTPSSYQLAVSHSCWPPSCKLLNI